ASAGLSELSRTPHCCAEVEVSPASKSRSRFAPSLKAFQCSTSKLAGVQDASPPTGFFVLNPINLPSSENRGAKDDVDEAANQYGGDDRTTSRSRVCGWGSKCRPSGCFS